MLMHAETTSSEPNSISGLQKDVIARGTMALGAAVAVSSMNLQRANAVEVPASSSKVVLEPLPYAYNALEPWIDARTMEIHHDRHHGTYVAKCNSLIKGTKLESADLTKIMEASYGKDAVLYNNAAQSYNHAFYWKGMSPDGGGEPRDSTRISQAIKKSFGDYAGFKKAFTTAGLTAFGSGWAWLVYNKQTKKVEVVKTSGADNPLNMGRGFVPLLTMDVWEHAYYLKYANMRNEYVAAFLDNLVNWNFVEERMAKIESLA